MQRFVFHIILGIAATQLLAACTTLDRFIPVIESRPIENQRASIALGSLHDQQEIDAYIRLDNKPLRDEIRNGLEAQAQLSESFRLEKLKVRFARQVIALEATLNISTGDTQGLDATLAGDVILTFSGNQLIWLPHFNQLKINETDFNFEGNSYSAASEALEKKLLDRVNMDIADAVIVLGKNTVQIEPLPLGDIEVGAALNNFKDVSAFGRHELGGVFTVAASTILIEPSLTSIALDLEFIANISACPSDVRVTRSTFAREINNREPAGITRFLEEGNGKSHFFTEISGATRSTAVVHYWFADGQPVWLEELAVEPSYRWRTWSSMTIDRNLARNWEVIVVEKRTGCILHSQAITTDPAIISENFNPETPLTTFPQFKSEFEQRVGSFSILEDRPDVALIEISRPFLRDTLHTSLKDIQIVVNFDVSNLPSQNLPGRLKPFNADEIVCAERECQASRECITGFTQCVRRRDNRDCTTCLFKNPLNNRCVTEGTDPICEAAKATLNAKYDAAMNSCMAQEEAANLGCQRLLSQEIKSCELEADSEQSACQAGKAMAEKHAGTTAFSSLAMRVNTSGGLSAIFSGLEIEGDLERIRLDLGFSAALDLAGNIRFAPGQSYGLLSDCMNAWQSAFDGKVVLPQMTNSMIGMIKPERSGLITDWSGYVVTAPITPTPLESMFMGNPKMLTDCRIGLTVDKVSQGVEGRAADYLTGSYRFELQPLQSRIRLAPATLQYGGKLLQAEAELSDMHLKYDIKD